MNKTSHLDVVSAIWILASNDENPLITYESIKFRLGLNDTIDLKELVKLHGELFRLKAPNNTLEEWKQEMLKGNHLPSWLKEIGESEERNLKIKALSVDDVFRSQFRTKRNAHASDITIINWGLEHLDRVRKTISEGEEKKYKKLTSFWIPIFTTLFSVFALYIGYQNQKNLLNSQIEIKRMELEYKNKQSGYSNFMKSLISAYTSSSRKERENLNLSLDNMETSYYEIEHLLDFYSKEMIWNKYQMFSSFCYSNIDSAYNATSFADSCLKYKTFFRSNLQDILHNRHN